MPLPVGSCADDISTDVCCSSVFDVADRLRCIATEAVECCFDASCADRPFRSYVSVGPSIPEPLGDALIVHLPSLEPSTNSRSNAGTLLGVAVHVGRFDIELRENGWPMPLTNEFSEVIQIPDSTMINAIARHAYSHGEKMYRAVVNALQMKTMFPILDFPNVGKVDIAGLRPIQPAAFAVGWTIPIQVQLVLA